MLHRILFQSRERASNPLKLASEIVLALLVLQTPALHAAEFKTLSGQTHKGELVSIGENEVKLAVEGKELAVPLAELLAIELQPSSKPLPSGPHQRLRLIDGTTLTCNSLELKGNEASVKLFSGQALKFPIASVHWLLTEAQDEKNRKEFEEQLARKASQDVLRLLSRDGTAINAFEGFVGDADAAGENLDFKTGGNTVPVAMSRVRGIIFSRKPGENAPTPLCKVSDGFENHFAARKLTISGERFQLVTPTGLEIETPRASVARLDFSMGKVVYLSDLEPLSVDESFLLADLWHFRRDKNLEGGPISLGRKVYAKGIAVHSRTVIVYDVKGYNNLRCVLGIDDQVTGPAQAVVRFEADGNALPIEVDGKKAAHPLTLKSRAEPQEIKVDLSGVTRLRITVDYGDDLDLGDHVLFADARVTK